MDGHDGDRDDTGGDPACWAHQLCPECGAVPTPDVPDRCWRCGWRPAGDEAGRDPDVTPADG